MTIVIRRSAPPLVPPREDRVRRGRRNGGSGRTVVTSDRVGLASIDGLHVEDWKNGGRS